MPLRPLLAGLSLLVAACDAAPRADAGRPVDLLLVTVDTLWADHVGAYGARPSPTPTLDRLAREGVRFATAIAPTPLTLPSHATLLTGLEPPRHGVRHNGLYRLDEEVVTLAERLRESGRATAAFVSSFALARPHRLDQGFDRYDDTMTAREGRFDYERRAGAVTDAALAWLAERREPFFLWIHYYDPHAPYRPPSPFAEAFPGAPYAGEIAYADAEIGRLLAALQESGRLDRTLVAVTADHGESLGEHLEADHSYTVYGAATRVPLILRGPGVPAGRVVDGVVGSADVAPTLLGRLGLPPLSTADGDVDGRDLARFWAEGAAPPEGVAYAETLATKLDLGWSPVHAVRSREHLYVRVPRPELYDVVRDPGELENLLEGDDAEASAVAARLDAALDAVLAGERGDSTAPVDAATLEGLRALGYAVTGQRVEETGLDPKDGMELLRDLKLAEQALDAGQGARARELGERVLAGMPGSSRAHALIAFTHLHGGDAAAALPHLERAVELAPLSARYRAVLGDAAWQVGRHAEALAHFRGALELDANEPTARVGLALERVAAGDLEAAAEHGRLGRLGDGSRATVPLRLGMAYERHGHAELALAHYREAVEVDPDLGIARMLLAAQLARRGDAAGAREQRARAGALARDPRLWLQLARAHARGGDAAGARRLLDELVASHPDFAPARRSLAALSGG